MKKEASLFFDATSETVQNSTCTCSDCGTAFCVSKRDHDTNQCIECKGCDAALSFCGKSLNSSSCKQSRKSMSEVNHSGGNVPKNSEFQSVELSQKGDESQKNLSTTTAQLSAQIMNLSYREFKESISRDKPERVTYSTNDILKRIKDAYDKCSCKVCECLTGQSVLTRINNCARSPCDCEPCDCKDCQDFLNMNNDLLNIGIDPRLHCIQKTNTVIEQIQGGFSKRDNQSYTCNPCNCEPCRCNECTKDVLNFKSDTPVRYVTRTKTVLERLKNELNKRNDETACNCEPCDCKDCKRDRLNIAIDAHIKNIKRSSPEKKQINGKFSESAICNCKPCDCIKCVKNSTPCDCEPCECYDCKSMPGLGKKTVIVAPVEDSTPRANCLCAPCDCARCSHRGLNLSPNRVHEISTGINRHPNCHCEACVNEACEPNGTGSCRCEGRHGVISKPVENNPHDFDIRRATVSSKPLKPIFGNRFVRNSTYVAMNINKFPSGNSRDFDKQRCMCSVCECIVCKCKGNDFSQSKLSQNLDGSLRTLKLPSKELKSCQCIQCECQYCALKKQGNLVESVELKSCKCEKCDCINCEGELKPKHTLSKLIPVMETGSKDICRCKPCECNDCKKMTSTRKFNTCHCDICRCDPCTDEANASHEALYPIKKGEIFTHSMVYKQPLSEPELLSQSSEYTQIKHSMAQSNVFNSSKLPERSQQNFTIYHMFPEKNIKKTYTHPVVTLTPDNCPSKLDFLDTKTKSKGVKILDPNKEYHLDHSNCPSTSKTNPRREISIIKINTISCHQNNDDNEDDVESPFFEDMVSISKISRSPSLLSIPQSAHNLVCLTPTCLSFHRTSCHLSVSSPNRIMENSKASFRTQKKISDEKDLIKSGELKQGKCHYCGSVYTKSEINKITQTPLNFTNYEYNGDNSNFEDPVLRFILSDYSKHLKSPPPPKYVKYNKNDENSVLRKEYYTCRLEHPKGCSYGISNEEDSYDNTAPYERALITLKRAKEFSLELVTLLQKYDKANMEFESITKKLKQSHESILNDFKNDVLHGAGKKDVHYLTQILLNNSKTLIDVSHKESSNDKEVKEIKKYGLDLKPVTTKTMNSLCAKQMDMIENKSSEQFNSNLSNKQQKKVSITNLSPAKDSTVELNEKQVVKNSSSPYKAYKRIVKRSGNILKKLNQKNSVHVEIQADNMYDVTPTSFPAKIETDLLKTIIRQEVHNILKQFGETTNNPMLPANNSLEKNKTTCEILEKEKPVKIQETSEGKSYRNATAENKPKVKGKGSIIYVNRYEAIDSSKTPSPLQCTVQHSSSHKRHLALERLHDEVKELLNLAILQSTSTRHIQSTSKEDELGGQPSASAAGKVDVQKTAETVAKSKVKEERRTVDSTTILPANPKCNTAVTVHNKGKCPCEVLKPSLEGLRRVSDHTVMVKWQPPRNLDDIRGFEVLVDGKPMDKVFLATERMAVVTCLPHSERVRLGVRTVPRRAPVCGHRLTAALLYCPRERF